MKKIIIILMFVFMIFLTGCDSATLERIEKLESEIDAIEEYDDTDLLADIAALEAELALLEEYNDTALLALITALTEELAAIEEYDDTALLAIITSLEAQLALIEEYDDATLLASIIALEAELALVEEYDDTELLSIIDSLEEELVLFESKIGPIFSNIPRDQVIEYYEYLDLLNLGITATDNLDGDITASITVDIVSTSWLTVGNHAVTYSVTDSDGNERSETIDLTVQYNHYAFSYLIINDNSEIMLTGYKQPTTPTLTVPTLIGGLPVTTIGEYAFIGLGLTGVTLTGNLVEIKHGAFSTNNITTVSFPSSIEIIGGSAFAFNEIADVTISVGVSSIGIGAFKSDYLESYSVAAGNQYYKSVDGALYNIDGTVLVDFPYARTDTTYVIPEGVIEIGDSAFEYNDLVSVTLPSTLQIIGGRAFYECDITSITLPEGLLEINYFAFRSNELTTLTIPSSVLTIGGTAFSENAFTSITILGDETRFNYMWAGIGFPMGLMP